MPLYRHGSSVVFFVHIPKTGGTTIESALRTAGASEALRFRSKRAYSKSTLQHMHADVYTEAIGKGFADWAFAVVRNPYHRFVSEYKMKVRDVGDDVDVEAWAEQTFARYAEYKFTRDNHIRPQYHFVRKDTEVFAFEDGLERPIRAATERLELPIPEVPHAKRGSSGRIPASRRAIELIGNFYAEDFARFGYGQDDFESAFEFEGRR